MMTAGQVDILEKLFTLLETPEQVATAIEFVFEVSEASRKALAPILLDKVRKFGLSNEQTQELVAQLEQGNSE